MGLSCTDRKRELSPSDGPDHPPTDNGSNYLSRVSLFVPVEVVDLMFSAQLRRGGVVVVRVDAVAHTVGRGIAGGEWIEAEDVFAEF